MIKRLLTDFNNRPTLYEGSNTAIMNGADDAADGYVNPSFDESDSIPSPPPPPPVPSDTEDTTIEVDEDKDDAAAKEERKRMREVLYFREDKKKHIDYILVWQDDTEDIEKMEKQKAMRKIYERNLKAEGLELEYEYKKDSVDGKSNFIKLNVGWEPLCKMAELLYMPKRIKMSKEIQEEITGCCQGCMGPCEVGSPIIEEEDEYFTTEFDTTNLDMFDIDPNNKEFFFTNAERSLVVREILGRTPYTDSAEAIHAFDSTKDVGAEMGINRLLSKGVYSAAYPIHEGPYVPLASDEHPFEGRDKDRARLYEAWARPGRLCSYQPLDLIRKYFGEKIAIYFAWLGFYTVMLVPASIAGVAVFIYGGLTVFDNSPSQDICVDPVLSNTTMCPECDRLCTYWTLGDSCIYSRITYLFDNFGTVCFAGFMAIWATVFLEFWKRKQKEVEYDWDVADFELEEPLRPEFEYKVTKRKKNPITLVEEPYMPFYQMCPRQCTSLSVCIFMIALVIGAIFAVIIYRIIVVVLFYKIEPNETIAKLATSITASCINFILIVLLNMIYTRIATFLTELETPRTWTEYEDSFTFKMFLFQFVNYYGSIFYIAFFKGSFAGTPGQKDNYLFGEYRQDACDPSGCLIDLFIQLAVIMTLKQVINNFKEVGLPFIMNLFRKRKSKKGESEENLYMRWEQDNDLAVAPQLGLFDEYLEMVIQFGFVTLFVTAFPLAPLFALVNNVIEIRLDAYKFTCAWRRPPALKAQDIGVWYGILRTIAFVSVITNAFIIGWTSDFVPKMVFYFSQGNQTLNGYIDSSLSIFDTNDYENGTAPDDVTGFAGISSCRYRGYQNPPDVLLPEVPYEFTKQFWIIFTARLAFVIVFEHAVFIVTWIVATIIPDTPARVKRLQLYERELTKKLRYDAAMDDNKPTRNGTLDY